MRRWDQQVIPQILDLELGVCCLGLKIQGLGFRVKITTRNILEVGPLGLPHPPNFPKEVDPKP